MRTEYNLQIKQGEEILQSIKDMDPHEACGMLVRFITSLDNHRGMDIMVCYRYWLKTRCWRHS